MRQTTRDAQLEAMLTARQVADFLQVSISTVRRWSDSGMLKCYRVGSRGDRRYRRDDVLRFLEEPTDYSHLAPSREDALPHRDDSDKDTRHHRTSKIKQNGPRHNSTAQQLNGKG